MDKIRVAVLYGGRSGEHEVSLMSAASVLQNLDKSRFDVVPIAIDKGGRWLLNDLSLIEQGAKALPVFTDAPAVVLPPFPGDGSAALAPLDARKAIKGQTKIDVIFPVMHGPLCEDGTIQGLLELADVAYVGCGVMASAVGMDKDVSKRLARDAKILVVPWITLQRGTYNRNPQALHDNVTKQIGYPCFVKPANMGSSVGVVKVKSAADLADALKTAFAYDTKVLIEKAINCREVEVAVLEQIEEGAAPLASVAGEVIPHGDHEFYSYEAKYLDEHGAALKIPAGLSPAQQDAVRKVATEAFMALGCEGLTRVDFLLDKDTHQFYFNEVNTMPGFTSISMYPKLMAATGVPYAQLLTHLIELALKRHRQKQALQRDYSAKIGK